MIPLGILGNRRGGAVAGAYELISTVIASGGETSISFSSIAGTYKHLQVRFTARDTNDFGGGSIRDLSLRFNGVSSNSYVYHELQGSGSSVYSAYASAWNTMPIRRCTIDDTATSGVFGSGVIDILDYASTSKNKTVRALAGISASTGTSIALESGLFLDTSAISSITFYPAVGFKAASRFSLYGIK